jgi:transposase
VSLELSRSTWLITSLSPGGKEKLSKHSVQGGDVAGLLERFAQLRQKARARTGEVFRLIVMQEAGLDGFWIHRVLQSEGIESHVVDPASIATSRRRRRAKTDRIDGETISGGIIVLDDYGWRKQINQKIAFDRFSELRNVKVLSLPTGQGIIIKP